ncbi:MAG TPA: hypothetical protein PKA59_04335 [Chakrabartia sp.]|nr:hypothetical protein [Chakrabartia sp.]
MKFGLAWGLMLVAAPAVAQDGANWLDSARLMRVKAAAKTYFHDRDTDRCTGFCPRKAFVVKGDAVVALEQVGAFVEAEYINSKGVATRGWLRMADLMADPGPKQAPSFWMGDWKRIESDISIRPGAKAGTLSIRGDALWGSLDPARVKRGAVNIGEIEGVVTPKGFQLSFAMGENGTLPFEQVDEYGCAVRMRLMPPYLLVEDNYRCGGMNVSFTGTYVRKPARQ